MSAGVEALEALKAILSSSGKSSPEAQQALAAALAKPPEPSPTPKQRSLADILSEPRVAASSPTKAVVDLMVLLREKAANGPPPPVKIIPDTPSAFASIGRGTFMGRSPFASIATAGPKKREKKGPGWQFDPTKKEPVEKLSLLLMQEMEKDGVPYEPHPNSSIEEARIRAGVQVSFELERILAIPRRPLGLAEFTSDDDNFPKIDQIYARPTGTMRLWPIQRAVLVEAARAGGLLGPIGVGHGKTLASLLVGVAMGAKKIVLLVPPQLRTQLLEKDIPHLSKHWKLPLDRLRVVAYSELSNARSADVLDVEKPDLIVADEAHNLRHRSAARTKRFLRYFHEHPECRLVVLSGTLTRRSLKDYQHLSELALQKNSPLPRTYRDLEDWAMALDVSRKDPMPPGALLQLCTDDELKRVADEPLAADAQVYVRQAFRRRVVETPGVVATDESALGTSLVITGLRPLVPAQVKVAIEDLHQKWEIGDEELVDAMSVARVGRQLAGGFYYRWIWPDGMKDFEWLEARKAWNKEVRDILKRSRKGLDSPLLITNAILRGEFESGTYAAWAAVKGRYNPTPPTEAVWLSKFLVEEAVRWGRETCTKAAPGIIWYEWDVLGREIAKVGDFPFFGPGMKAGDELTRVNAQRTPVIVCSRQAHGTGKNLQQFCRNLFTTPSPGGVDWEQTIARTHRPGQEADDVFVDVFLHTDDMQSAFDSAIRDAHYIEQTQGQKQKLLYARKVGCGLLAEED
jgi:hypothetical protein